MTHRIKLPNVDNHLTVGLPKPLTYKPVVLYSLFKHDSINKRWIRVGLNAYTERLAYRVYSDRLATAPLSYTIRPIKVKSNEAQGPSRFRQPNYNHLKDSPLRGKREESKVIA